MNDKTRRHAAALIAYVLQGTSVSPTSDESFEMANALLDFSEAGESRKTTAIPGGASLVIDIEGSDPASPEALTGDVADTTIRERLRELANGVRYAGGNGTSDYWRGFNDGIDRLLDDPAIGTELDTLERRATAAESVLAEIAEGTESDRIGRYDLLRDWVHTKARSLSETRAALEASRGSA